MILHWGGSLHTFFYTLCFFFATSFCEWSRPRKLSFESHEDFLIFFFIFFSSSTSNVFRIRMPPKLHNHDSFWQPHTFDPSGGQPPPPDCGGPNPRFHCTIFLRSKVRQSVIDDRKWGWVWVKFEIGVGPILGPIWAEFKVKFMPKPAPFTVCYFFLSFILIQTSPKCITSNLFFCVCFFLCFFVFFLFLCLVFPEGPHFVSLFLSNGD